MMRNDVARVSVVLPHLDPAEADGTVDAARRLVEAAEAAERAGTLEVVLVGPHAANLPAEPALFRAVEAAPAGVAALRNLGARHGSGDVLVFPEADAPVSAAWIEGAVEAFAADGRLGCVACARPDASGQGAPASGPRFDPSQPPRAGDAGGRGDDVLFPDGSLCVPRHVFEEVGGFDETIGAFYEDVDFGWRVNLAGYDVRRSTRPAAPSGPGGAGGSARRLTRGALACLYKNLGPDALRAVLPSALALAARAEAEGFLDSLPELVEARERVQGSRRRPEGEVLPLLREALDGQLSALADSGLVEGMLAFVGLDAPAGGRAKILVVSNEPFSRKLAGPAIRAWEMAKRLSAEHEVRLCSTSSVADVSSPDFDVSSADPKSLQAHVEWAQVVVFQGALLEQAPWLVGSDKILVADLYDPAHLEQLEQARDRGPRERQLLVDGVTELLNRQIARGDFFLCASDKQRDFWLGHLGVGGRINAATLGSDGQARDLVAVCPFGLDERPPVRTRHGIRGRVPGIGMDDKIVLWGGGVYNWFDPLSLIEAVDELKDRRPNVRLYFLGMKHPNPGVPQMRMAREALDLSERLGLTGRHVFFNHDWVPYEERQDYLLDADVGVSTHVEHVENRFSFRTRILDYLWAGLPIVATRGDSFGDVLDSAGIGISVAPGDVDGLARALEALLYDEARAAECSRNVAAFARQFEWARALAPLLDFCRRPHRAADIRDVALEAPSRGALEDVNPGFDLARDLRLVLEHVRSGGVRALASKTLSRAKKYLR